MQTRANIKRLTKTFVTLSLADVASRIGLASTDQAERHIVAMVQEGSIHARISQKDGKFCTDVMHIFNQAYLLD